MKRYFFFLVFIIIFLSINLPKTQFMLGQDSTKSCSCIGYSRLDALEKKSCFGIIHSCEYLVNDQLIEEKNEKVNFCTRQDCEAGRKYLGFNHENKEGTRSSGMNLLLVVDTSLSMSGEKVQHMKDSASRLIEDLYPEDFCAIISFNNKAEIVHPFSKDKASLAASLANISAEEDTRYLPALDLAGQLFDGFTDGMRKDVLIFLSDGDPLDEIDKITDAIKSLKTSGIEIYTVRFNETNETVEDDILSELASYTALNGRAYVQTSGEDLYLSFREIYESAVEQDFMFNVESDIPREVFYMGEKVPFRYSIKSAENLHIIPGYTIEGTEALCVESASAELDIAGNGTSRSLMLSYVPNAYVGEADGLPAGNYSIFINVTVMMGDGDGCYFSEYMHAGDLEVKASPQPDACKEIGCEDIRSLISAELAGEIDPVPIVKSKRLLVALDTSDSMGYPLIESSKESLHYLVDLFSRDYEVAIAGFSQEASLAQRFISDTEKLKQQIDSLPYGGTTRYEPLYRKANYTFSGNADDHLLIISDGNFWDNLSEEMIIELASDLVGRGVCIHAIRVGNSQGSPDLLLKTVRMSVRDAGCGTYTEAFAGELNNAIRKVYMSQKNHDGDLDISVEINRQTLFVGESLLLEAWVSSAYNNLAFPSEISLYGQQDICLPRADLGIQVSREGDIVHQGSMLYLGNSYGYVLTSFEPGIYDLVISARTEGDCDIHGKKVFSIIYEEPPDDRSSSEWMPLLLAIDIAIIAAALFCHKKFRGK